MVNDQSMYNEMNSDIENILKDNNIEYVKEYEVGCRNVDYYLPNKNIIIECDG